MKASGGDRWREGDAAVCDGGKVRKGEKMFSRVVYIHGWVWRYQIFCLKSVFIFEYFDLYSNLYSKIALK